MPNIEKLEQSLDQMIQLMVQMKQSLKEGGTPAQQATQPAQQAIQPAQQPTAGLETFDQLRQAVVSDKWPEAVNPNLICDPKSETDKSERGRGIIELMIEEDLKSLKMLDIGCGEGHLVDLALSYQAATVVGYDIREQERWGRFEQNPNKIFTSNFDVVRSHGPYDIITIFDVIDHVQRETPSDLLFKANQVLADNGKIYMRCHPFTSRHGTHLYHGLNKAYAHLVFTEPELQQLEIDQTHAEPSIKVVYPLKTYAQFVQESGLKQVSHREITEKVENFFKIPKIAERIMKATNTTSFPEFQMSLQFVDYVLKKA